MFDVESVQGLLKTEPFVPFQFLLNDGREVEVRNPELVLRLRHCVIVGHPYRRNSSVADGHTVVWYAAVARIDPVGRHVNPDFVVEAHDTSSRCQEPH